MFIYLKKMTKIFIWLSIGLTITGMVSFKLLQSFNIMAFFMGNEISILIIALIQLAFVIWLSMNLDKITDQQIKLYYIGFAFFNGISLPLIFQFFNQNYLQSTFFILAIMFLIQWGLCYFLKKDFGKNFTLISLTISGIVLNILVNIVWRNDQYQLITSGIAILVFIGILAYDYDRINKEYFAKSTDNEQDGAIKAAFSVYLNLYYFFIVIVLAANKKDKKSSDN